MHWESMYCRSWHGWLTGELAGKEMIVPEVSRVIREPVDSASTNQSDFLLQLFNRPRSFSESVSMCFFWNICNDLSYNCIHNIDQVSCLAARYLLLHKTFFSVKLLRTRQGPCIAQFAKSAVS